MSSRLSLIDASLLIGESRRVPLHMGALSVYNFPDGVDETEYLQDLASFLRSPEPFAQPFGHIAGTGRLGVYGPINWERDEHIEYDYHIRHSALPKPGRFRELFALVSRLHSILLDRSRPLWEIHLVEGLEGRKFATFSKFHHCMIDGVRGTKLMSLMHSTSHEDAPNFHPFSEAARNVLRKNASANQIKNASRRDFKAVSEAISEQFGHTVNITRAVTENAKVWLGKDTSGLDVPLRNIPSTILNQKIQGARRFVAQSWSFMRIRRLAKSYDGTINDAILAMVSGALVIYLQEHDELPKESLKTLTVISLRDKSSPDASNAIGNVATDLATNIKDPVKRALAIQKSAQIGKNHLKELTGSEAALYMALTMSPIAFINLMGLAGKFPPYNTVVSNVPGPREQLYLNGAKLIGNYPASMVVDGIALNFTIVSTSDTLDFGITACRRSVPQVQRVIDYLEGSLQELENAFGLPPWDDTEIDPQKIISQPSKAAAKPKTKARKETKASKKPKAPKEAKPRKKTARKPNEPKIKN